MTLLDQTRQLAPFLDTATGFAETASYRKGTASPVSLPVIVDDEFVAMLGIETADTTLLIESAALASLAHGDTFTVRSTTYYVIGNRPDGTGMTRVILSKTAA